MLSGCYSQDESFAELQASYFSALNIFDPQAVRELPELKVRMDRMASATLGRLANGELTDPAAQGEGGRVLFYAGFLPLAMNQAIYDGFAQPADILQPHRYAVGGSDQDELLARVSRSLLLLNAASPLRPNWAPAAAIRVGARYDLEEAMGQVSQSTLDAVVDAAQPDIFGSFSAIILTRNPAKHPLDAPYMERLFALICSPERFNCDQPGPPPVNPNAERTLTSLVAGPVILSDFLVRRAELLVARADANPAQARAALDEAMGRLQMAAGALLGAQINAGSDELSIYPAGDTFDARQGRIDQVMTAVMARLGENPSPPPLPEAAGYYASRTYRAAYQCAACHRPRPNLPASFGGIPK